MAAKRRRRKKKTLGAGTVILGLLFTLGLAALMIFGMYMVGQNRPVPASKQEPSPIRQGEYSLFTPSEPVTQPAPVPAAAPVPVTSVAEPYGYERVIYDQDGLLVAEIIGKRYTGYIAIVDDPLRLSVGVCPWFGQNAYGRSVEEMVQENGAILGVNGGGFEDVGGVGKGGMPTGNVFRDGQMLWGYYSSTVGMDAQGKLHVGEFSGADCQNMGLQWAVSYGPTLIEDGVIRPNLDNYGQEPRTAIGQREDGAVVIVVLQGRQLQALGVTCLELANIMAGYGCVNAGNLDGGASSDIYFNGEYLNVCNTSGGPRPIPTAVLVAPATDGEG